MGIRTFLRRHVTFLDSKYLKIQTQLYLNLDLNRSDALDKLNIVVRDAFDKSYDENFGMWSEHLVLFSAISNDRKLNHVNNILEIGTFRAETTFILSKLFQKSEITTIDLPKSELIKDSTYEYEFMKKDNFFTRNSYLNIAKAKFIEANSLKLIWSQNKYDLIWLDGDHTFPIVIVDLINAIRMINSKGLIICDDIIVKQKTNKNSSVLIYDFLCALQKQGIVKFSLIPKRIGTYDRLLRPKFIGVIEVLNSSLD